MHWWGIEVPCQKCEIIATLIGANFSADGELRFIAQCPKCQDVIRWHVYSSSLAHKALMSDSVASKVEKMVQNTPLQPPIAEVPPEPEVQKPFVWEVTDQDRIEGHSMGITPDDPEETL